MAARGGLPSSGAWSNQVDEEAEANGGELAPPPAALPAAFPTLGGKTAFPALGESLSMKDSKKERKQKKVKQTMSLGAFVAAGRKEPEIINLPTGPRQRSEDEEDKKGALGGGFKNYGGDRGGGFDRRDRDEDGGGFGDREEEGPSRADAADDWGTKKAFVPSSGPTRGGGGGLGDRKEGAERERGGGFGDRYSERRSGFGEGDLDRADNADKWGSKTFEPSAAPSSRRGGFEDRERGGSGSRDLEDAGGISRADTEDRWSRRSPPADTLESRPSSQAGGFRTRLALKPRSAALPPLARATSATPSATASVAASETSEEPKEPLVVPRTGPKPNPFGAAKPVDVKEKVEASPSVESAVSQPSEEIQQEKKAPTPPKPRMNPFGAARPREEVLKEKEAASARSETASGGSEKGDPQASPSALEEGTAEAKTEVTMESKLEEATGTESKVQEVSNQLGNGLTLDAEHSSEAQVASKATAPQVKAGGSWAKIASAPKSEEDVAVE